MVNILYKLYIFNFMFFIKFLKIYKKCKIKNVKAPFQRIGIDIIRSKKGNRYIVTAIDYFTKWLIVKVIKEAIVKTVSKFIYKKIICEHRCLQIL